MKWIVLLTTLALCGCTEEGFRDGGHNLLAGICAQSSHCTVNCDGDQTPDRFGRCGFGTPK